MDAKIARVQSVAVMRSIVWLVVAAAACRGSDDRTRPPPPAVAEPAAAAAPKAAGQPAEPPVTPAYAQDIEKLCDAVKRSGADQVPAGERAMPIARWLAANLTTSESRGFLIRIQPLTGNAKADALEAEAHRVGHDGCALAAEWRL
jgi:hypothetical protein